MNNFTPKQRAVILALSLPPYPTLKAAAQASGVSDGTVHNWNMDEQFRAAWQEARARNQAELRDAALSRIYEQLPSLIEQKIHLAMKAGSEHVRHLELKDLVDRVLGQSTQKQELTGPDGGAVEVKHTHEHSFDFDAFQRLFADATATAGDGVASGDGSQ